MSASAADANGQENIQVSPGCYPDPRSTARVSGGKGGKERKTGFLHRYLMIETKNLTSTILEKQGKLVFLCWC